MVEKGKFVGVRGSGADLNLVQLAKAVEFVPNALGGGTFVAYPIRAEVHKSALPPKRPALYKQDH